MAGHVGVLVIRVHEEVRSVLPRRNPEVDLLSRLDYGDTGKEHLLDNINAAQGFML